MSKTLQGWVAHFGELFGNRNRIFQPTLGNHILYLAESVRTLDNVWRKNPTKEMYGLALSRILARAFTFGATLDLGRSLTVAMSNKYPAYGCAYCGQMPCACGERRPEPMFREDTHGEQVHWTLTNWQRHSHAVYGEKNSGIPLRYLIGHLSLEVSEVGCVLLRTNTFGWPAHGMMEYAKELADVISRTLTFASLVGVMTEPVLKERYEKCPKCDQNPCGCGPFEASQINVITGERE